MSRQQITEIGNQLEAVSFYSLKKGKPRKLSFAQGTPEEVEPIVVGVAEAHNVDHEDVATIASGVRMARDAGMSFQSMNKAIIDLDRLGYLQPIIEAWTEKYGE